MSNHQIDHYAMSVTLMEQVEECQDHLADLYGIPPAERDARLVAKLHAESGTALKLAEVHATLAVAQQLRELHAAVYPIVAGRSLAEV